uniref:RNA-editing substrate-binding complex 6 protein domain-containing protein n=1 Tax=Odontella aurita TaxID=265563 RepID=A0A7S4J412_9STRA
MANRSPTIKNVCGWAIRKATFGAFVANLLLGAEAFTVSLSTTFGALHQVELSSRRWRFSPGCGFGLLRDSYITTTGSGRCERILSAKEGTSENREYVRGERPDGRTIRLRDLESRFLDRIKRCSAVCDIESELSDAALLFNEAASRIDESTIKYHNLPTMLIARALKKIVNISDRGRRGKIAKHDSEMHITRKLIPELIEAFGKQVLTESKIVASGRSRHPASGFNVYALQEILYVFARFQQIRKRVNPAKSGDLRPLAEKVCSVIVTTDFVRKVGPRRLVETLWALAVLGINHRIDLLTAICDRLTKADAFGMLSGKELATGLWSQAVMNRPHIGMIKVFMRRLRKQRVREDMTPRDLSRALWASGQCIEQLDGIAAVVTVGSDAELPDLIDIDLQVATLRNEAETMCHTLTREVVKPSNIKIMTAGQVADILSCCVSCEMDNSTPMLKDLSRHLQNEFVLKDATCGDISRILLSFQKLYLVQERETICKLGERFLAIVNEKGTAACSPKELNTNLRSVVMLFPRKPQIEYFDAAAILMLDHGMGDSSLISGEQVSFVEDRTFEGTFLSKCNEFEVSNIIWSFAKAKIFSKNILLVLADRMMELSDRCSPSSASRVLWSYTMLVSQQEEGSKELNGDSTTFPLGNGTVDDMREKQFELFRVLGGVLLSSQLTPVDASAAMWAMAKASYPLDMGIFDHLAEVLACDFILERAMVRHIAQALWACGKMTVWEDPLQEKMGLVKTPPPYLDHARKFATFLLSLEDQLTSKDVAQSIWALGRLGIADRDIVRGFAVRATIVSPACNAREIANILWGLSKLGFSDRNTIRVMTDRLTNTSALEHCTSQDAACVMYALGKMKIRDPNTFTILSTVIMERLNDASARAIANALWAHEAVNIVPPRAMLNLWANQYLEIVGLHQNTTAGKGSTISQP